MEPRYDPRYCPRCYQYVGNAGGDAHACRACFGDHSGDPETSFEAAFIVMADVDGGTGEDVVGTTAEAQEGTVGMVYAGDSDFPHTD